MSPASLLSIWACTWFGGTLVIGLVLMASSAPGAAQSRNEIAHADAQRQDAGALSAELPVTFAIPSQRLETALKAFASAARVELFYESSVIAGQQSFSIHGTFAPEVAMRMMLQGTGLSSTSFDRGTITILSPAAKGQEPADLKRARLGVAEFSPYLALVQTSLDQTLCHAPVAAGDPDELFARLWISPVGGVQRADLLSGTGSAERDRFYLTVLATVSIGERPPAAMPQPINLMLMPKKTRRSAACLGSAPQRSRSAAHD